MEFVGVLSKDGKSLVYLSEWCSQIEGGNLDGPILFNSIDDARSKLDEIGVGIYAINLCKVLVKTIPLE